MGIQMEETGTNKAVEKGKRKPMTLAYGPVPEPILRNENISGECCKLFAPNVQSNLPPVSPLRNPK